ncbi:MAG TPA: hypothetical protein PK568_10105, partial [Bacillota bacterium]|nr:hypothetical protein [Bacillota bacterium]
PTTGFEVQERHQAASYSRVTKNAQLSGFHALFYQESSQKTRLLPQFTGIIAQHLAAFSATSFCRIIPEVLLHPVVPSEKIYICYTFPKIQGIIRCPPKHCPTAPAIP